MKMLVLKVIMLATATAMAVAVPVNLAANQLLKVGGKPVQFSVGVRYWAAMPERGPEASASAQGSSFCSRSGMTGDSRGYIVGCPLALRTRRPAGRGSRNVDLPSCLVVA